MQSQLAKPSFIKLLQYSLRRCQRQLTISMLLGPIEMHIYSCTAKFKLPNPIYQGMSSSTILFVIRQNPPVLHAPFPICYPPLLYPYQYHSYFLSFDEAIRSTIPFTRNGTLRLSKEAVFFPRLISKGIVLQMPFFAPFLLLATCLDELCFPVDRG